ncbi:MAG: galactokinase [Ginsengibacter sp.]
MTELAVTTKNIFKKKFNTPSHIYYSPGRINLIGEHVDYNDGFVMPGAIDKGIYFAFALNDTDEMNFYAIDFGESLTIKMADIKKMDSWKNYVLGVVNEFLLLGKNVKGFNCVFGGNIANGAGMSSSAAVEGGMAFAINESMNFGLNRKELALLCQRAEHNFPGVKCGIMDQYANMFGKRNHVILLDCQSITHEYLPLDITGYKIVLINSKVHHALAASEYNQRRKECEEGLIILKRNNSTVSSFRDVNPEMLAGLKDIMNPEVYKRCLYVVEEIIRTKKAAGFLKQNNIVAFGKLMFETHEGLRDLYDVSCEELNFLADHAATNKDVVGARLMGGGFGGCTINIVKEKGKELFVSETLSAYKKEFDMAAEVYEVNVGEGTNEIKN